MVTRNVGALSALRGKISIIPDSTRRPMAKKVKYGKIGAPKSAKRKAWMKKIAKKGRR